MYLGKVQKQHIIDESVPLYPISGGLLRMAYADILIEFVNLHTS